ncbi:MAG: glycoside hydrolase family 3 protein [Flammeovirgaceae bacterium]|nr:glycoside hydrolase family 3 protein [Flammeovirgaceae bacterium]
MTMRLFFILSVVSSVAFAQTDSLEIKIGQMLLMGIPEAKVDSTMLEEVKRGRVGSIILFEKNIPQKNSFNALKKITWTYQKASPIPLLISIDQEGGKVNRLKDKYGFPRSITATALGRSKTLDSVRFYGESTAATLAGLGINVNFAPVVDVAVNPDNPVIVKIGRSFSANEDSVTLLAREFVQTHRKYNVITVLKHFPGHGSSKEDTHFGLADVTNYWQPRELKPYQQLISTGFVDAIMSAHIVNRKLEPEGFPGTLSKKIIQELLRDSLKYKGVVFSDDMHMHAIAKNYGLEESIKRSINAGIDILCFANNVPAAERVTAEQIHSIIKDLVKRGEISKKRIDESYKRVMRLKRSLIENHVYWRDQIEKAMALARANEQRAVMAELEAKRNAELAGKKKRKSKRNQSQK